MAYRDAALALLGEIYHPTGTANGRAVLIVHEAGEFGGNVRRRCTMLAGLGYVAVAADLHEAGRVLETDEVGPAMARFTADPVLLRRRMRSAVDALRAETGFSSGSRRSAIVSVG